MMLNIYFREIALKPRTNELLIYKESDIYPVPIKFFLKHRVYQIKQIRQGTYFSFSLKPWTVLQLCWTKHCKMGINFQSGL